MPNRTTFVFAFALLGTALAGATLAQSPRRLGTEFMVNSHTLGTQLDPSMAMDDAGNFVVVWTSQYLDGAGAGNYGIAARRFNSAGTAVGADFQVNLYTPGEQYVPVVAMNGSGAFVVAWRSPGQDGAGNGGFARRFSAAGVAQGGEIQVSVTAGFNERVSGLGIDDEGDFAIAWASEQDGGGYGVFVRRWSADGTAQGAELQVNSYTPGVQSDPDLAMEADGDFIIAWTDSGTGSAEIRARRYTSSGAPLETDFPVNNYATGTQSNASVDVDAAGNLIVVWTSGGQDGFGSGIFGRRFDSSGAPGVELQIPQTVIGSQERADVAIDADGDFTVTWETDHQGATNDVYIRRTRVDGSTHGGDIRVNFFDTGDQERAAIAGRPDGDFVVVWTGFQGTGDVFAQRHDVPSLLDVDGNGSFEPLEDGIIILRFGFEFTGATLIDDAVGDGCTRCDAPSIEAYLRNML